MADAPRARRLAKRISQIVASSLEHEVKDPRLAMVTITDTRLTADLREATVYYTVYGGEAEVSASAAALASARGVLRTAVGQGTGVRYTPSLAFERDAVPEGAARLDELLDQARRSDAEVAAQAAGADYAGDAQPYRTDDEVDELEGLEDLEDDDLSDDGDDEVDELDHADDGAPDDGAPDDAPGDAELEGTPADRRG